MVTSVSTNSRAVSSSSFPSVFRDTFDTFGVDYTPYDLVNAMEVRGGTLVRLYLLTRPEVDRVIPSPRLRPAQPVEALALNSLFAEPPPSGVQWNVTMIGADKVWDEFGVRGEGIVIGQSDSGVDVNHPDIKDSYRGKDEGMITTGSTHATVEPRRMTTMVGTHTLGTVLGQNGIGVAPGATWFACMNLNRNLANPALYLDCMQFMLAPFPLGGDPFVDGDPSRAADEQTRIARETHDDLCQSLTALNYDLAWLTSRLPEEAAPLRDKCNEMTVLTDATITSLRRIASELRPKLLDDLGLEAAAEWLTKNVQTRTGLRCELDSQIGDRALDPALATAVFRILQEALTNVARHAHATAVRIEIYQDDADNLVLTVRDDGKGIVEDEVVDAKSLGLLGTRERALGCGGVFRFQNDNHSLVRGLLFVLLAKQHQNVRDLYEKHVILSKRKSNVHRSKEPWNAHGNISLC